MPHWIAKTERVVGEKKYVHLLPTYFPTLWERDELVELSMPGIFGAFL